MTDNIKLKIIKNIILFLVGYCAYIAIEVTYRSTSYSLMGLCGGLALLILDKINDKISWDVDILIQSIIGSLLITDMEAIIGSLASVGLVPRMWDYSSVPLNFHGIICLSFSILWMLLSFCAIMIADAINYYLFEDSDIPYYKLFGKVIIQFKKKRCDKD